MYKGHFTPFAPTAVSANLPRNADTTIIEFVDLLNGIKKVDKRGDTWVIEQTFVDDMTRKKLQYLWGFTVLWDSYREIVKCDLFLSRLIENDEEMPEQVLRQLCWDIVFQGH